MEGIMVSLPRWIFLLHLKISLCFLAFLDILDTEDGYRVSQVRAVEMERLKMSSSMVAGVSRRLSDSAPPVKKRLRARWDPYCFFHASPPIRATLNGHMGHWKPSPHRKMIVKKYRDFVFIRDKAPVENEDDVEDEDSDDEDRLRSTVRCHSVNSFAISPVSCLICRLLQESSLFRTCTYEFKAPSPYQSSMIKITLRDGHYILLLEHLNDVIKGIDSFESVRHISPLRRLVHALLGYQVKPFRMSIQALDCCEFLKKIQSLLDGWMAIYQTSALSPCPESTQISLVSEVVRVSWSRVDHNECVVRYKHTALEVFDISVCNDDCGSDVYLFHLSPSALFLFDRFGNCPFRKLNSHRDYC